MSGGIGPLSAAGNGPVGDARPAAEPVRRPGPADPAGPALPPPVDSVELAFPFAPPPDALAQVAAAAERAAQLAAANRELHFQRDEASGRIIVQVRDLEGRVIRTIPPSKALDVMAGMAGID